MKCNTSRWLCGLVALIMVVSLLPVSVLADGGATFTVTNQEELTTALNQNRKVGEIHIVQSFTVTEDSTIQYGGDKINYYSDTIMTIAEGVTLTVGNGGALGSVWATFEGDWDSLLLPNGKCINNGTIILEKGGTIDLDFDTNNGTITVKDGGMFLACVTNNGTVTVESGGKFASGQGGEIRNNGVITVANGAELESRFGSTLNNTATGTLILNGDFRCGCFGEALWFHNEGDVEGNGSVLVYEANPKASETDLDAMIAGVMENLGQVTRFENWDDIGIYRYVEVSDYDELTAVLTEERTIAGESVEGNMDTFVSIAMDIFVSGTLATMSRIIVPEGVKLTIADGGTLGAAVDNFGTVEVASGGTLATTMGGNITNYGTLVVNEGAALECRMGGRVINERDLTLYGDFRCNDPYNLITGIVNGSNLIYAVANSPENATLVAARYDNGIVTDVKMIRTPPESGTLLMGGSGTQLRLFLWYMTSCKPLCESWKND